MKTMNQIGMTMAAVAALTLGACSTPQGPMSTSSSQSNYYGMGTVQSVELVKQDTRNGIGLGTVAGAVIGGVVGNQVGEGTGRTAATVLGAAGGAYAGNRIENRDDQANDAYKITVRMDNGEYRSFVQVSDNGLRTGDRARVENGIVQRY
ncbi:MAG: hypothetical protein JWL63_3542 [Rhodocyclales bacterium]|nr:hypothetical protein [Rhodocyclales bacterium]